MLKFDNLIKSITEEQETWEPTVIKLRGFDGGASDSSKVVATIDAIYQLGTRLPSGKGVLIDGGVQVELKNLKGKLHLKYIYTVPEFRDQGLASAVLGQILDIADENDVAVTLHPKSINSDIPTSAIIKWYEKFGFEGGEDMMIRE